MDNTKAHTSAPKGAFKEACSEFLRGAEVQGRISNFLAQWGPTMTLAGMFAVAGTSLFKSGDISKAFSEAGTFGYCGAAYTGVQMVSAGFLKDVVPRLRKKISDESDPSANYNAVSFAGSLSAVAAVNYAAYQGFVGTLHFIK